MKNLLITGGAGFIGNYVSNFAHKKGYNVTILDNLDKQVHGAEQLWPDYLHEDINKVFGDVRDSKLVNELVAKNEYIIHLASAVGVGQSMYEVEHYTSVNSLGTGVLLQAIVNNKDNIKKLILASSMSVYGEGSYIDNNGDISFPEERKESDMINFNWEFDGYTPIPTNEEKPLKPSSIYALNKREQEESCLCIGKTYNIPTLAFRMFNVYGPYQALSNPYTGVVAIFSSHILSNKSPIIYEDGLQMRDFVYVEDVANAYINGLEKDFKGQHILNLGSGEQINIYDVAKELSKILKFDGKPDISNKFRSGDIRNCFGDITKIKQVIGWEPKHSINEGMKKLLKWLVTVQKNDLGSDASEDLEKFGLLK